PAGKLRCSEASSENWRGPRIELRPASPQLPAAGKVYAAGLRKRPPELSATGAPVRSGRTPVNPVPGINKYVTGVSGSPLAAVSCEVSVQPRSSGLRRNRYWLLYWAVSESLCRWSKSDGPRSASRRRQSWAVKVVPADPRMASSSAWRSEEHTSELQSL